MSQLLRELARIEAVWRAFDATVTEAGPLPQNGLDMPAYTAAHYKLMRRYDPQLARISDEDILEIMRLSDLDCEED
jgi:hypothetical protein